MNRVKGFEFLVRLEDGQETWAYLQGEFGAVLGSDRINDCLPNREPSARALKDILDHARYIARKYGDVLIIRDFRNREVLKRYERVPNAKVLKVRPVYGPARTF